MDYNFLWNTSAIQAGISFHLKEIGFLIVRAGPVMNNDFSSNFTSSPDGREQELSSFQRDAQRSTKPFKSSDWACDYVLFWRFVCYLKESVIKKRIKSQEVSLILDLCHVKRLITICKQSSRGISIIGALFYLKHKPEKLWKKNSNTRDWKKYF